MTESSLPTITRHQFFFETSLYDPISISDFSEDIFTDEVDAYSPRNDIDTTYKIRTSSSVEIRGTKVFSRIHHPIEQYTGYLTIYLKCKRREEDELVFYVIIADTLIVKIGQFPSLADIQFSELGKKYDKVLPKEDLKNFKKAIGLYAHSAGAGSFVYLRRIFENLVLETFQNHRAELGVDEKDFITSRMEDKIEILKLFLPDQLVKMKKIYSILSLGVHELSEDDCLKFFPALKLSIELILDQKIESIKKKIRDEDAQNQINSILQELA